MECCQKTTGMLFKPKTADQMEKWKERNSYTGTATADFQICIDHFSVSQFRVDTQYQMLGLPARKKGFLLSTARESLPYKQLDGLKITEGLEGERMKEEEKFKNRKKVF